MRKIGGEGGRDMPEWMVKVTRDEGPTLTYGLGWIVISIAVVVVLIALVTWLT